MIGGRLRVLYLAVAGMMLAACNPFAGRGDVVVLDLAAVAKATGQDKVMEEQMVAARETLAAQLGQIAGDLEKQLQTEQSRRGGAAAAAREQDFQQLAAQARQQLAQTQALAQQKAQDFQMGLAAGYRQAVQPVVTQIAQSRGASVVLVADASMLWFDPDTDITAEVIAELRSKPVTFPTQAPAGTPDKPAARESAASN
jgi:Skp family chaperone for outer membrane proteins